MRSVAAVAVVLLLAAFPTPSAAQHSQSQFVVTIIPSQNGITPGVAVWTKGVPVFFIIHMTNNSEQTLHFSLVDSGIDFRTIVLDSNGNRVPETDAYRELRERYKSSSLVIESLALIELKPDETCTATIDLSYLFDLSRPGKYTVQIERDSPLSTGVVVSNKVTITIEE
jgi:hypothetical protein